MAKNPLFSTYRQGENRVTSSMLAVFERIDLSLLETILAAAAGEASPQMVSFTNQPPGRRSVPDARISAWFAYWFEVKTARNALGARQLADHLAILGDDGGDERLFVVTPDAEQPDAIATLSDARVVWFNFRSLSDAIDAAVSDPTGNALVIAPAHLCDQQERRHEAPPLGLTSLYVRCTYVPARRYIRRAVRRHSRWL